MELPDIAKLCLMPPRLLICLLIALKGVYSARAQGECNIKINERRILREDNLDYFLTRLRTEQFAIGYNTNQIPAYISKKLRCLVGKIANPDQAWNATDEIFDEALPYRKLKFCAVNAKEDLFVIVYLKGGVGVATITVMMSLTYNGIIIDNQKNVADIWIGQNLFQGNSIPDLVYYINRKRRTEFGLNTNGIVY